MNNTLTIEKNEHFNQVELAQMETIAEAMFDKGITETHTTIGGHGVSFKRSGTKIEVFKMNGTLDQNEKIVTQYNKRK